MKILAVGMNYAPHNKEMKESLLPKEPVVFSKPDSALLQVGRPFFIPDFDDRIDYEAELVVKISKIGRDISEQYAHRYYDEISVGIDFTARTLQSTLRKDGLPWEICKGFDGSAALGRFVKKSDLFDIEGCTEVTAEMKPSKTGGSHVSEESWRKLIRDVRFHLDIDGTTVQTGHTAEMLFGVDRLISYMSRFFTLKTGDIIYTGTPAGVGPVKEGQLLEGFIGGLKVLDLKIK